MFEVRGEVGVGDDEVDVLTEVPQRLQNIADANIYEFAKSNGGKVLSCGLRLGR